MAASSSLSFGVMSTCFFMPSLTSSTVCLPPASVSINHTVSLATASKPATSSKRVPRGIMKPRPISPEMQELVGMSEIPRTQALKHIWAYIKENNLQDPQNKKVIICDEKLKKIFAGKNSVGFLEIAGAAFLVNDISDK
ncbi:hypothetical protein ACFE04_002010 [Oxalis oulophora]